MSDPTPDPRDVVRDALLDANAWLARSVGNAMPVATDLCLDALRALPADVRRAWFEAEGWVTRHHPDGSECPRSYGPMDRCDCRTALYLFPDPEET